MADLKALLAKVSTGAAAEGAARYFGEKLAEMEHKLADQIEEALRSGTDHERMIRTARWVAVRELQRAFARDIKAGQEAAKEL